MDCPFRVEEKNITPNPFYVEENQDSLEQEKPNQSGLGKQLAAWYKKKKLRKK